jgi:predicted nucleic acid-binding protein
LTAFILDSSVTMRWCFENTSTPYADEVLEQLLTGQQAHVPVLWLYEVVSVLAKAQRSASITADKAHGFLEDIRSLDITVDDESLSHVFGDVHRLAVEHGLSGYDAAYLELAIRKDLPLATLDEELQKAANTRGSNYSIQSDFSSVTFSYSAVRPAQVSL